jgi:hypothetical protein
MRYGISQRPLQRTVAALAQRVAPTPHGAALVAASRTAPALPPRLVRTPLRAVAVAAVAAAADPHLDVAARTVVEPAGVLDRPNPLPQAGQRPRADADSLSEVAASIAAMTAGARDGKVAGLPPT